MVIGTVVRSNSHISYLCRVYGKLEVESVPTPGQYAFGTFVTLLAEEESNTRLVGIVRDTLLLNPEFGNLGPRLSDDRDLEIFSPDYLNERGVLVDILILGWLDGPISRHTIPPLSAQVGTPVETMDDGLVERFHRDGRGHFFMGYLPQLMARNDPILAGLLLGVLDRLEPAFPEGRRVIGVLRNNLAWKARVVPAG